MENPTPRYVYRAFDDPMVFHSFLSGRLDMNEICSYRKINDEKRRDGTEGTCEFTKDAASGKPELMLDRCEGTLPAYILSTCLEHDSTVKFGKYVARIECEPFEAQIREFVESRYPHCRWRVLSRKVQYNKRAFSLGDVSPEEIAELALFQKEPSFAGEKEYRFAVEILSADGPEDRYPEKLSVILKRPGACLKSEKDVSL